MSWVKELLKEIEKRFPVLSGSNHALTYDSTEDQLLLFLNLHGGIQPVGFTEEELQKDPKEIVDEIQKLVTQKYHD